MVWHKKFSELIYITSCFFFLPGCLDFQKISYIKFRSPTTNASSSVSPVMILGPLGGSHLTDNTPTVFGTAEPFAMVQVIMGGGSCLATANSAGNWMCDISPPLTDGNYSISATQNVSGVISSPVGIGNVFVDTTPPTVSLSGPSGVTNLSPIPITITFDEEMNPSTIGLSDFAITNGSASNLNCTAVGVNPTVCTIDVTPTADGAVTVNMAANVADDLAGNDNTAATPLSVTYDGTAPSSPVIDQPANGSATNDNTPTVSGLPGSAEPGATVTASVGSVQCTALVAADGSWSCAMPTSIGPEGSYTVTAFQTDSLGNVSSAGSHSFMLDTTAPSVTLTTSASSPTNSNPIPVTATFSEEMNPSTIGLSDFAITNGSASNLNCTAVGVNPTVCTIDVTPISDGLVTVNMAANVADDLAGNDNTAATPLSVTYDGTAPSSPVIDQPANGSATNDNTPTVSGLPGSAEPGATVTASVGSVQCTALVAADGSWSCAMPTSIGPEGSYTVTAFQTDSLGNVSSAGSHSFMLDTTAPSVTLTTSASSPTNSNPILVTATFSEEMNPSTIGLSDFAITNGSASNLNCTAVGVNPTVCTIDVTPISDGLVTVNMAANVADDLAGNDNTAATPLSVTYDGTAPSSPVIDQPANGSATNDNTPTVSGLPGSAEPGATVTASVGSVQCTALVAADGSWSCDMPTSIGPEGSYTVTAFQTDSLGNVSAADSHSFTLDTTAPNVTLTTSASSPTSASPILVTATFSEEMDPSTIGLSDFAITNGSVSNLNCTAVGVNPTVCTIDVTPISDGLVTVNMAANVADDLAGNDNTAATQLSVTYDGTAPSSPVIDQPANGSATNDDTPTVSGLPGSAEPGATVTASVGSVQCTALVAADGSWSCDMPTSIGPEGSYTVTAFQTDSLGNVSTASSHSFTLDTTAPSVALTTSASSPTNSSPILVTATFSEEMNPSTIGLSDFAITNGSASNLNCTAVGVNPTVCTIDVTPISDGLVTVNMAANVADDLAGNDNTAATQLSVTYDGTAPASPVIDQPANGSATNDNTPTVSGLPGSAEPGATVTASVGSVQCTALVAADGSWSCDMPTSIGPEGSYTVTAFQTDSLGNVSSAGSHSFMLDTTAPSVALTTSASSPTNSNPIPVTATFSEEMNPATIGLSDFAITNGTASNLNCTAVGVNPTVCTIDVTPTADGAVTVNMAANVADDLAGNDNTAATPLSVMSDTSVADPIVVSPSSGSNVYSVFNLVVTCPEVGAVISVSNPSLIPNPTSHTCMTDGNESISMTFASGATGNQVLSLIATDSLGNMSGIVNHSVYLLAVCSSVTWSEVTPNVFGDQAFSSLAWADYDGDSDLDLVASGDDGSNSSIYLYRNDGAGNFSDQTPVSFVDQKQSAVAWADYDGDLDLDLVASGYDNSFNSTIYLYRNDGSGNFTDVTPSTFVGQGNSALAWADYDGDGDVDLVATGGDVGLPSIHLYRNDGGGNFSDQTPAVFVGQYRSALAWADYDGDGDVDLVASGITNSFTSAIYLYRNEGGGNFTDQTPSIFVAQHDSALAWADYDSDGDLDLVASGTSLGVSIFLYRNDGGGNFSDQTPAVFAEQGSSDLAWADYDGDGDLDLVGSGANSSEVRSIYLYRNDGGGNFSDQTPAVFVGQYRSALAWGDYDSDGDLDLVGSGSDSGGPSIYLYENDCTP